MAIRLLPKPSRLIKRHVRHVVKMPRRVVKRHVRRAFRVRLF